MAGGTTAAAGAGATPASSHTVFTLRSLFSPAPHLVASLTVLDVLKGAHCGAGRPRKFGRCLMTHTLAVPSQVSPVVWLMPVNRTRKTRPAAGFAMDLGKVTGTMRKERPPDMMVASATQLQP